MTEKTTIQVSTETKGYLDGIKQQKEPYDGVLKRMITKVADSSDERYVTLRMSPEEYRILMNRQDWVICTDILTRSRM